MWRAVATALGILLLLPAAARAQDEMTLDPLRVWVEGNGALQVAFKDRSGGAFAPSGSEPARVGLELLINDTTHSPVDGNDRTVESETEITTTATAKTAESTFRAAGLRITEYVTVNSGDDTLRLRYEIVNPTAGPLTVRAGELGAVDGQRRSWQETGFLGTRDRLGRRVGLVPDPETPWSRRAVETTASLFEQFRSPAGLNDGTLAAGYGELAVGAQWNLGTIGAGQTRTIRVGWKLDVPGVIAVNTTVDGDNGACDSANCTLREALTYAERDSTIQLEAATYQPDKELTFGREDVTLLGRGARATTIDGRNQTRLLHILDGQLAVRGVTFTRGNGVPGGEVAPFTFALRDAITSGSGGAIAVEQNGFLELFQSAVQDNTTTGSNSLGGGIASEGRVRLESSTIARNRSGAGGGGIAVVAAATGDSTEFSATNSTIAENTAGGHGGGVYAGSFVSLDAVTLTGNSAEGLGGGFYRNTNWEVFLHNTLLARNERRGDNTVTAANCGGTALNETYYSFSDDTTCTFTGSGNVAPAAARIGRLANNGGPTDTVALQPGSPAVDKGDSCQEFDQRGARRGNGDTCDIGAYETTSFPLERLGRIPGRPLDITANGMGQLQLRLGEDPLGAFKQQNLLDVGAAGLAFVLDGTAYPVGPAGQALRTAVSGPRLGAPEPGRRTLRSEYYVGDKLLVTETVSYSEGAANATLTYSVRNVSDAPVSFRAAQLAALSRAASGQRVGNRLIATAANGGQITLTNEGDAWRTQIGADVYAKFYDGGLDGSIAQAVADVQVGGEWVYADVPPDASRSIQVSWTVDRAPGDVTVNTTTDDGDGTCTGTEGGCTLREALDAHSVINVPAGTYELNDPLTINGTRIIRGAGARMTILKAVGGERVLHVPVGGSLGLSGVTVTGGRTTGLGGGIFANDTPAQGSVALAVADSAITGNTAESGGGIAIQNGRASILRSTISGNRAVAGGSGSNNGSYAGMVAALVDLHIANSTISGNTAAGLGGGLATQGIGEIVNSTITGNTALGASGLYVIGLGGGGNPDDPEPEQALTVDLRATIVADNLGAPQCQRALIAASHSIVGDSSCELSGESNRVLADPKLGPLADNGGPTDTHLPLAGSPALDTGGTTNCAPGEQRALILRPYGGQCDIGAVEVGQFTPAPPETPALESVTANGSTVTVAGRTGAGSSGIELYEDGQQVQTTDAAPNAPFSFTRTNVADGTHSYYVRVSNGNGSAQSNTRTVTIDTTPPAAPQITGGDAQQISGQAEPGSTVTIYEGEKVLGAATAGPDGVWTFALSEAAPGDHVYTAVARDAAGHESPRSDARTINTPAVVAQTPTPTPPTPTPTPTPEPQLPPPVTGEEVNVEPEGGKVLIKLPGSDRFVELKAGEQIPTGTTIDTTQGRVTLSSLGAGGKVETAVFYEGIFKVTQTKGPKPITVLTLTEKLSCPKKGRAAGAAAKKKSRRLWGSGKGSFRTQGQYSAATVRGTTWLTQDTCTTTLTRVTQGVVEVRDQVKGKTIVLRAPKRYTARARGR